MTLAGTLRSRTARTITLSFLAITFVWCFWSTLVGLLREWRNDQDYSVGQIVVPIAIYMVWADRKVLSTLKVKPLFIGYAILAVGLTCWLWGVANLHDSVQRYSLILVVAGLVLAITGPAISWRLKTPLAFLLLMVPLPGRVHNLISGPLQNTATASAFYVLELLGVTVTRDGNTLMLDHSVPIAIAEACSGLRMLSAFVVVSATFAMLTGRSSLIRAILLVSSIPIALFCNLVRLVATALLFLYTSSDLAERFFHDFAGWLMMPLAVILLIIEWRILLILLNASKDAIAITPAVLPPEPNLVSIDCA